MENKEKTTNTASSSNETISTDDSTSKSATVSYTRKKTEELLSDVGAKIADAEEIAKEIIKLEEKQKDDLIKAQEEVAHIYEILE